MIRSKLNLCLIVQDKYLPNDISIEDITVSCKSMCTNIPTQPPRPEVRVWRK